jgi:hypothetical protein
MKEVPDLTIYDHALRVVKRPLPVKVRFAEEDGVCETLEGTVGYRSGAAILTGIAGETWPVGREQFDERYEPGEGVTPGRDGVYVKKPLVALAIRLDDSIEIPMPNGGLLRGEPGDWLLQYGVSDYGIVRDDIFLATYEILQR